MEETLRQLGGILLRAVPTFILVVLLHFYLKFIFFKPLQRVLRELHSEVFDEEGPTVGGLFDDYFAVRR